MNEPDNGEYPGEVLYIHKDLRAWDAVSYTIDDIESYRSVYSKGFMSTLPDEYGFGTEIEGCEYINSLLKEYLGEKAGKIQPTSWENRWDASFFPTEALPERYTVLKVRTSEAHRTGEHTMERDVVIEAEYVNSRAVGK